MLGKQTKCVKVANNCFNAKFLESILYDEEREILSISKLLKKISH